MADNQGKSFPREWSVVLQGVCSSTVSRSKTVLSLQQHWPWACPISAGKLSRSPHQQIRAHKYFIDDWSCVNIQRVQRLWFHRQRGEQVPCLILMQATPTLLTCTMKCTTPLSSMHWESPEAHPSCLTSLGLGSPTPPDWPQMKACRSWIHLGGRVVGSILGRMSACLAREKASEEAGTWQLQNTLGCGVRHSASKKIDTSLCSPGGNEMLCLCSECREEKAHTASHQPLPQVQSCLPTPHGDITKTWRHFCPPSPLLRSSLLSWALASLIEGKAVLMSEPEGPTMAWRREPFNGRLCLRGGSVGLGGSKVRMASVKLSVFHFCSPFSTVGNTISACQTLGSTLWGIF